MSSFHHFFPTCLPDPATPPLHDLFAPETLTVPQLTQNPALNPNDKPFSIVELHFEEQNTLKQLKKLQQTPQTHPTFLDDLSDESTLLRYKAHNFQEQLDEDEPLDASCAYSTGSTLPSYIYMSKYERINYFARLNWQYEIKMKHTESNSNLNSNSDIIHSKLKTKPTIRFSDIVHELPFSKDDEPNNLAMDLQVQTQIRFDPAAYQIDQQGLESDDENSQSEQENHPDSEEQYYQNDDVDEFNFDENIKNTIFSNNEKIFSIQQTSKQDTQNFPLNHEPTFSEPPKIPSTIHFEQLPFEQEEEINVFKRDANRNYLSESSTSSDSNSSDSSASESRQIDYNDELQSYLAPFLNGRKINPNTAQLSARDEP